MVDGDAELLYLYQCSNQSTMDDLRQRNNRTMASNNSGKSGLLSFVLLLFAFLSSTADANVFRSDRSRRSYSSTRQRLPLAFTESQLWAVRAASAASTYFGFIAWSDRPQGRMMPDYQNYVEAKQSTVPGAALGLFVKTTMRKGTELGTYPGVVVPLRQNTNKLRAYPQCESYIWRFSDNEFVIDPTNTEGEIEEFCKGGNPAMPLSTFLFCTIVPFIQVPTTLGRINEPPKGRDVNVVTSENRETRTVTFSLERDVYEGEELFIDYGFSYDRSQYGG
jgi:hypothetical protein